MCYGSDFTARATVRLLDKLQIETILSKAFSPWQKGYVERHIRTFQTDCSRMLPGFIGHSVADRKRIEGRKTFAQRLGQEQNAAFSVSMSGAELQAECDAWAERLYATREHRGIGKMTPFARAASSTRIIRTVDPDALATLLMQAPDKEGLRTVGKKGVQIGQYHYLAPGLVVGERVFVRLDPHDAGVVWLFDPESDRLLARGINSDREGVDRAALVAETRALQKRAIDEKMKEVRAVKRGVTERTVLDLRHQRAAELAGNLVAFPPRTEIHSTPALDAGALVADLRRHVETPLPVGEEALQPRVSIGYAVHPDDGPDIEQLPRHADRAMYAEKYRRRATDKTDESQGVKIQGNENNG